MKKTIEINGKPVELEATAMTDHMADKIFGINISYAVQHAEGNEDKMPDLIKKITFVMAKRAELGGWRRVEELTEEDFCDWLDGFDSYAIETEAKNILELYASNKVTRVTSKNAVSPQHE